MAPRVLDKKLKRVREMKTDTPSMLEALDALATFYVPNENTLDARRNLRADLESRGLTLIKEFMAEFEIVQQRLDCVKANVDNIHYVCDDLLEKLEKTSDQSAKFLAKTDELRAKRDSVAAKAKAMDEFLERFQLSEGQLTALSVGPREEDNGEAFFEALHHVGEIRRESQALLSTQFQSAGLEIFEAMARNQNMAHQKLFDSLRDRCKQLDSENPEPSLTLIKGLRALQSVQAYHELSRELVVNARRASLVRRFRVALIHGGPNGTPRPIQMHAHDPFRYIGDILAWIHQAVAFEKDLVTSLFLPESEGESKIEVAKEDQFKTKFNEMMVVGNVNTVTSEILNRIFESMCSPLMIQVRQVVKSPPVFVSVYKIANLFKFYRDTISQVIPMSPQPGNILATGDTPEVKASVEATTQQDKLEQSLPNKLNVPEIVQTLNILHIEFTDLFFRLVQEQTEKLMASPPAYPQDLSVAVEVSDLVRRLAELLSMYNQSLSVDDRDDVGTQFSRGNKEAEFTPVLNAFVEPLLITFKASASGLDRTDAGIYIINNIFAIQDIMTQYDFTSSFVEQLTMEIGDWMDHIVTEQSNEIWNRCGMHEKLKMLDKENISAHQGMDAASLQTAFSKFYQSMFSMVMPEFDRINNPRLRTTARNSTARSIALGYERLYNALFRPESGYDKEELERILVHAPEQVSKYILDA